MAVLSLGRGIPAKIRLQSQTTQLLGASSRRPAGRKTNTTFTHWALRSWRFHPPLPSSRPSRRPQLHSPPGPGFVCGLFALHSPLLSESQLFSPPALSNMLEFSAWPCTAEVATQIQHSPMAAGHSDWRPTPDRVASQVPSSASGSVSLWRQVGPRRRMTPPREPPPSAPHAASGRSSSLRPSAIHYWCSQCCIAFGASMILYTCSSHKAIAL